MNATNSKLFSRFNVIIFIACLFIGFSYSYFYNLESRPARDYSSPFAGGDSTMMVITPEP